MKRLLCVLVLLSASPALAQDQFPVSQCQIYNSPDVRNWPATVAITRLTLGPGHDNGGLSYEFDKSRWPNYTPPGWTPGGEGLMYTAWIARNINGQWHCAGAIQMWRTRQWTGAPFPDEWFQWTHDPNRWGPLASVPMRVGERVCTFLTAGNARKGTASAPEPDVTTVAERSNAVCWEVPPVSQGSFAFAAGPVSTPDPVPVMPPVSNSPGQPVTVGGAAFRQWATDFERWARDYAEWSRRQTEYQNDQLRDLHEQAERIYADLAARIEASSQKAPTEPVKVDQGSVRGWVSLLSSIGAVAGTVIQMVR